MANISASMQKSMLDWSLAVTAVTRPAGCFVGLSIGAPTSVSSSEAATTLNYVRSSLTPSAAVTAGGTGTATNVNAVTFGTFNAAATLSGIFLSDTVSTGAGTMLWFGNLAAARTVASGDQLVLASGALVITLV